MATKEQMAAIFRMLRANWPKEPFTAETVLLYEAVLGDLPEDLLRAAVLKVLSECTWFPRVGEIRGAAADMVAQSKGYPTALEAWGQVRRWLRAPKSVIVNGQRYVRKALPEPVTRAIAALGGETMLRESENVAADRARFVEAYNGGLERERDNLLMLPEVRQVVTGIASGAHAQLEG